MPDSKHPKPDDGKASSVLKLSDCPNCGRKSVAVFPVSERPKDTFHLVCPHCYRKPPNKS